MVVAVEVMDHKAEQAVVAQVEEGVAQETIPTPTDIIDKYQLVMLATVNQAPAAVAALAATMVDFHTVVAAKVAPEL